MAELARGVKSTGTVLVADDDESVRLLVRGALEKEGFSVTEYDPAAPEEGVFDKDYDVAVLDMSMPPTNGFEVRREIVQRSPLTQFIMMTGMPDREKLSQAMDLGFFMFLTKPVTPQQLLYAVLGGLRVGQTFRQSAERHASGGAAATGIVGRSKVIAAVRRRVLELAPLEIPVLVTGESGTGKEVVARAIHKHSQRSAKEFTAINCAGLSPNLIESELFGHTQGAFTGATKTRVGFFEATDGGTVFLDEIGDMPLDLQSRLLRVLDRGELNRVGDTVMRHVNVRVVSATNCDLERMVSEGRFRGDLFYRLRGTTIHLAPLRDRREDIPELVNHFMGERHLAVTPEAMQLLQELEWPGNVRELAMIVATLCGVCRDNVIRRENVESVSGAAQLSAGSSPIIPYRDFKRQLLDDPERDYFVRLLRLAGGNMAQAARLADMDRKNLYSKLSQLGIEH